MELPRDHLQRFHFDRLDIRGELAHLDATWVEVAAAHDYPPPVARLLGELLTATALLANIVKVQGILTLQATGDGPVRAIMAECRNQTTLRAIARFDDDLPDTTPPSGVPMGTELLGQGLLTITIRPEGGEPYQGIVALTGATLAEAVEGYFAQSEQIPTRLWLTAESERAAGMLLQALPQEHARHTRTPAQREEDFRRVTLLADTVEAAELRDLENERLLTRLFHEEQVRVQPPAELAFACTCNRDRTREALGAISRRELEEILEEEGTIRMECQFCHTAYEFDAIDVELVHRDEPPPSGPLH